MFDPLWRKLCEAMELTLSERVDDFVVFCDSSITGLGAVLMQRGRVVAYTSRHFEISYGSSVSEHEATHMD